MALQPEQQATLDEFKAFVERPENTERIFELIGGEITEVPSNPFVSKIAMLIGAAILFYLRENDIGHVTGADGGYIINGDLYAPDVAYISYERQPQLTQKGFGTNPPNLTIEVISDPDNSQEQSVLRRKVVNYLRAGTIVWVVDASNQTVEVYERDNVQVLDIEGTLSGSDVLPGFSLPVKDIFPQKKDA